MRFVMLMMTVAGGCATTPEPRPEVTAETCRALLPANPSMADLDAVTRCYEQLGAADSENPASGDDDPESTDTTTTLLPERPDTSLALADLVRTPFQDVVLELIDGGRPVDEQNAAGETALHVVGELNIERLVAPLVARGAKLDIRTAAGATPLDRAASTGFPEAAAALVAAGADPNLAGPDGRSPLEVAVADFKPELVHALLRARAGRTAATDRLVKQLLTSFWNTDWGLPRALAIARDLTGGLEPAAVPAIAALVQDCDDGHAAMRAVLRGTGATVAEPRCEVAVLPTQPPEPAPTPTPSKPDAPLKKLPWRGDWVIGQDLRPEDVALQLDVTLADIDKANPIATDLGVGSWATDLEACKYGAGDEAIDCSFRNIQAAPRVCRAIAGAFALYWWRFQRASTTFIDASFSCASSSGAAHVWFKLRGNWRVADLRIQDSGGWFHALYLRQR